MFRKVSNAALIGLIKMIGRLLLPAKRSSGPPCGMLETEVLAIGRLAAPAYADRLSVIRVSAGANGPEWTVGNDALGHVVRIEISDQTGEVLDISYSGRC